MPIYEYQCSQCSHYLESFEKITDAPLTQCPACEKPTLQKMISAAGFQLKGTGWYATDFRNKGKPPENASTKTEAPNESVKSDSQPVETKTTTDTKPKDTAAT